MTNRFWKLWIRIKNVSFEFEWNSKLMTLMIIWIRLVTFGNLLIELDEWMLVRDAAWKNWWHEKGKRYSSEWGMNVWRWYWAWSEARLGKFWIFRVFEVWNFEWNEYENIDLIMIGNVTRLDAISFHMWW